MAVIFTLRSPINRAGDNIFISWRNLSSVFELSTAFSIGAFAMTMVLLVGGIDLSCGSIIALTGVVTAHLLTNMGFNFVLASTIGLLVGVTIGLINGFLIIEMKVTPFLATLGVGNAVRGLTYLFAGGRQIWIKDELFINTFGFGSFLGIPVLIWWTTLFFIIIYAIIWKTKLGRRLQAVGGNETAAVNSGVNVRKVKYFTYIFMGFVCAFVSLTLMARIETAIPNQAMGYELNFIVASILGGTTFKGEGGSVFGALLGSLVVALFGNGLNLLGASTYLKMVLDGVLVICIIVTYANITTKKQT